MTQTDNQQRNIIIIDDDKAIWHAYKSVLTGTEPLMNSASKRMAELLAPSDLNDPGQPPPRFNLTFASQGQDGLACVKEAASANAPFSVAFIDIRMPPGWDGMETAKRIREIDPHIEFVIVTAYTDRSREEIVKTVGSPDKLLFLRKPFDPEELYQMALSLSEKWQITKQERESKTALINSEAKFRYLVETTSDFVWEVDTKGRFVYCSPVCELMYGFRPEELLDRPFFDLIIDAEAKEKQLFFEHCLEKVVAFQTNQYRCLRQDGVTVNIESTGTPIIDTHGTATGFRGIDRDITKRLQIEAEKKLLEEQYYQAQKMEAVGTLAGGIAHDLNNLLTPILGYTEISLLGAPPNSTLAKNLETIEISAQKAAGLISQILTFSRKKVSSPEVFNLNNLIDSFMTMLRRLIREDIILDIDLAEHLWLVNMDRGQIEQILLNLVVNARDAISKNGLIIIRTTNTTIATGQEILDIEQTPFAGKFVILSVSDNGSGMDKDTISRIFEPFFTTKALGHGTGLGLATVYGVTKQHNSHIIINSALGKGSTFSIYLPCTERKVTPMSSTSTPIRGGTETILLAEDDYDVRTLTITMLEELGYKVKSATNGLDALALYKKDESVIDLLITDIIMPALGGRAMVHKARKTRPEMPVLFISGYPKDMTKEAMIDSKDTDFIQKPFSFKALAEKIRTLLDDKVNE